MNVKIIADSTCDLPEELIKKYDIDIVNLYVMLDEVSYVDKLEMTPDRLIEWSNKTKKTPKTSAPTIEDYMNVFKPYVDKKQDVVFVSVSSVLSATCQNAFFASNTLEKATIKVVDGKNVTTGTGCVVLKAAELAQQGKSADEIVEALEEMIPKVKASFIFDNLEFLKRGGRCSALKALSASALKIRPKVDVIDGEMIPGEKFRGSLEKVVAKFCDGMLENLDEIDSEFVFVEETQDNYGLVDVIYEKIKEKNYFKNIYKAKAGCIITAHSGPNAYAIVYVKK
ncbi:MAG: DegV family protein [Clostridiales bacterium]|nr:DegV family protein [Clostridiales bacterium]